MTTQVILKVVGIVATASSMVIATYLLEKKETNVTMNLYTENNQTSYALFGNLTGLKKGSLCLCIKLIAENEQLDRYSKITVAMDNFTLECTFYKNTAGELKDFMSPEELQKEVEELISSTSAPEDQTTNFDPNKIFGTRRPRKFKRAPRATISNEPKTLQELTSQLAITTEFSDFDLHVGAERELRKVHKIFLARSKMLSKLISGQWKEKTSGELKTVDPAIFEVIQEYLYTFQTRQISVDNVCFVLEAADYLEIDGLVIACKEFVENFIRSNDRSIKDTLYLYEDFFFSKIKVCIELWKLIAKLIEDTIEEYLLHLGIIFNEAALQEIIKMALKVVDKENHWLLFSVVNEWGKSKLGVSSRGPSKAELSALVSLLTPIISLLDINLMSVQQLNQVVRKSNLVDADKINQIIIEKTKIDPMVNLIFCTSNTYTLANGQTAISSLGTLYGKAEGTNFRLTFTCSNPVPSTCNGATYVRLTILNYKVAGLKIKATEPIGSAVSVVIPGVLKNEQVLNTAVTTPTVNIVANRSRVIAPVMYPPVSVPIQSQNINTKSWWLSLLGYGVSLKLEFFRFQDDFTLPKVI